MPIHVIPLADPERSDASHRLAWLAADESGFPLGTAFLRLFTRAGQNHLAELELHVHPAERRKGVGSQLLDAAVSAARSDGRRSVVVQADAGTPGDPFLRAKGLRKVLTLTNARLPLSDVDAGTLTRITEQPHPGYRLVAWDGTVPDDLADTFVASRHAMDDMPMDDTDYGTVVWDVERVRGAAEVIAQRGDLLHTIAAVDESDGSIVGFSELVVPGDGTGDGQHYGTGVLPAHRGRGLALRMKADAIRWARRSHPGLGGLLTDTADSNPYMRRINDALGYRPTHVSLSFQLDL